MNVIEQFWFNRNSTTKMSLLDRYTKNNAPECIVKFIKLGGGPSLGSTMENFARFKFECLRKRLPGKNQTGYDQLVEVCGKNVFIEQKSSTRWDNGDYKWQHVEPKHEWDFLLLSGIDYESIYFWAMDRKTFDKLLAESKIKNQGSKNSSEGYWFNYSDVKDCITHVQTNEDLLKFAEQVVREQV